MCAIQRGEWARQKTGYGSRCQTHRFECVKNYNTAGLFTVSYVYQEWSTTQRTSSQLDTTEGSVGVNIGQHPCETLFPDKLSLF
jgi:hypothetical protein